MHKKLEEPAALTDSMKMFKMGLENGKPAKGQEGVQPEWFYKGDGSTLVAPGGDLVSPAFALDGGEEPEIVGVYLIDPKGAAAPARLRARQRILRPRHRAAELPLPRPFQAARLAASARNCWSAICRPTCRAPRASGAARRRCGRSRSCRASRTCRTRSPTSRRIISNTRCSAAPATCTCISSARRRCRSPTASTPEKGDVFEIECEAFRPAAAQPSDHRQGGQGQGRRALMRVLLTGAAGWLGRHLKPRLVARGHAVVGLDIARLALDGRARLGRRPRPGRAPVPRASVRGGRPRGRAAQARHRAFSRPGVRRRQCRRARSTCLQEAAAARRALRVHLDDVADDLKAIRAEEGDAAVWLDERAGPLEPRNIYGVTKLAAEGLCRVASSRTRACPA